MLKRSIAVSLVAVLAVIAFLSPASAALTDRQKYVRMWSRALSRNGTIQGVTCVCLQDGAHFSKLGRVRVHGPGGDVFRASCYVQQFSDEGRIVRSSLCDGRYAIVN